MLRNLFTIFIGALFLAGCSDSDSGTVVNDFVTVTTPPPTSPVAGGGVKGPLANAVANIYQVDPTATDLKGVLLGSGVTGANAGLQGLTVPNAVQGLVLLEITADADTIDITTGAAPILTSLRSIVDASSLTSQIYVTPLTTLAVNLAASNADSNLVPYTGNADGTVTTAEIQAALDIAAGQVVSSLGFGLPSTTNIFLTRPLLTNDDDTNAEQQAVLAYRQAIEGVSAILDLIVQNAQANNAASGLTPDQVLAAVSADLSDGVIDGNDRTGAIGALVDVGDVAAIATTDVTLLQIPGTTTLVSAVRDVLAAEVSTTGASVSTTAISSGEVVADLMPVKITTDADGDGVADRLDAFPNDASETVDTDGDGTGNNADEDDDADGTLDIDDAFPLDPQEVADTDNDGIGNNEDLDDDGDMVPDTEDALPLDGTETVDTDGDGIGNNADTDDDGDGTLDVADAFPLDDTESLDTDNDGTGNNADDDDDADGVLDVDDALPLDDRVSTGRNLVVGVDGGTVTSLDQNVTLTIPAGALDADTSITIGQISDAGFSAEFGDGAGVHRTYVFAPDGLVFNSPATATFTVDLGDDGASRTKLPFSLSDGLVDFEDGAVYDNSEGVLTAPVNHFSVIGYSDGTLSVNVTDAVDGIVGEEFTLPYSVSYDASDPNKIVLGEVFPEGYDRPNFSIQPTVTGEENVIANVMHLEAGDFPEGVESSLDETQDTGLISGACVGPGRAEVNFGLVYRDVIYTNTFGDVSETSSGIFKVNVPVFCEEPTVEITDPFYISIGPGVDRLNATVPPPYTDSLCNEQLYAVVSDDQTVLTTLDGSCQESFPSAEGNLGALLISDPAGERLLVHSLTGTAIRTLEEGAFSEFFGVLFGGPKATTDASYARNPDGSEDFTGVLTVSGDRVFEYRIVDGLNEQTEVFNAFTAAGKPFISYEPITDTTGIGVTNGTPSQAFFVDTVAGTATLIDDVGDGALNVTCTQLDEETRDYGCAVASRGSEEIVSLFGRDGIFERGPSIPNISTASPFVRTNGDGNLVVATANDTDGRVNLDVLSQLGIQTGLHTEFFLGDLGVPELALQAAVGFSAHLPDPSDQLPEGGVFITIPEGVVVVPFDAATGAYYYF